MKHINEHFDEALTELESSVELASALLEADSVTTLYRFFDHHGDLLYVGIAANPSKRFNQHNSKKPWWIEVAEIKLEHFPTRAEALEAERNAIRDELPAHNIQHNGENWRPYRRHAAAQCILARPTPEGYRVIRIDEMDETAISFGRTADGAPWVVASWDDDYVQACKEPDGTTRVFWWGSGALEIADAKTSCELGRFEASP
jgi:hypothetical protein